MSLQLSVSKYRKPTILVVLFLLCSISTWAQRPSVPSERSDGDNTQREVAPDTFGVFIFHIDNPTEETAFSDTLLDNFHQYDPTRTRDDDYANLGVVGSAHRPLVYDGRNRIGFDLGWHQYDLYYTTGKTMPFYRLERPFTNLSFMQGAEQRDNIVQAQFSRNFANGINYTLDYQAITQEAQNSQYPNQRNQTRALATGFWVHNKKGTYDGFLSYSANTTNTEDNGGITKLPNIDGEFSSPATAEVLLRDGRSRHALRELMYTHYYRFGGQTDSTGHTQRAFTLSHQVNYNDNTYRFADHFDYPDTSFYQRFPNLLLDARGARYMIQQQAIENSFLLSTYKLASTGQTTQRQQKDLLALGLTHRYNHIDIEPTSLNVNNLFLTGKLGLRPSRRLQLQASGALALLDQAGDFHIKGQLNIDLGKAGILSLLMRNQLYSPSLVQERFYLMQQELYNTNLDKTVENKLGATYTIPAVGIKVSGTYHLLNNYIYFDNTSMPIQRSEALGILQLSAQKDFKFGVFTFRNRVVFQQTDETSLRLPSFFGKHSLTYNDKWFKVLNMQMGVDLRYTTAFRADYYNPFIGQFQLQDRQEANFYPGIDAYFSMRVSRFRAFVKGENLATTWQPDQRQFLSAFYPWPAAAFRFGVNWRMLD